MDLLKLIFFMTLSSTVLIIELGAAFSTNNINHNGEPKIMLHDYIVEDTTISLPDLNRFLAEKGLPQSYTCDKFPRVCRLKGSGGPDCCKKKCVNVKTDRVNCGKCGYKCKYSEICCKGQCVNSLFDKRNCGGCQKKCKKGDVCAYGMCSYA